MKLMAFLGVSVEPRHTYLGLVDLSKTSLGSGWCPVAHVVRLQLGKDFYTERSKRYITCSPPLMIRLAWTSHLRWELIRNQDLYFLGDHQGQIKYSSHYTF